MLFILLMPQLIVAGANKEYDTQRLTTGRFHQAVDLSTGARTIQVNTGHLMSELPVRYEFWAKVNNLGAFNILLSAASKSQPDVHWELFTYPITGAITLYMPQVGEFGTKSMVPGQWHFIVLVVQPKSVAIYVDGVLGIQRSYAQTLKFDDSPLIVGGIKGDVLHCNGAIDDLRISTGSGSPAGFFPTVPMAIDSTTRFLFNFDITQGDSFVNQASNDTTSYGEIHDDYQMPKGERFLDEVQDDVYQNTGLYGDALVEQEARRKSLSFESSAGTTGITTKEAIRIDLNGNWIMKGCTPRITDQLTESEGVTNGWFRKGYDRTTWQAVQVPTSVQNALIGANLLPDPLWDDNTWKELHDYGKPQTEAWQFRKTRIEQQEWWFVRYFNVPSTWVGQHVQLSFAGIDYAASIYLNGRPLGYHTGMFGGPDLDVTGMLHAGDDNELVVRVDAVPNKWQGVMKGSPGWGWHYGHLISLGIWKDVALTVTPDIRLAHAYVKTASIQADKAVLNVELEIKNDGVQPANIDLAGELVAKNHNGAAIGFKAAIAAGIGVGRYVTTVTVEQPALWWPMNYGKQNLYELRLAAKPAGNSSVMSSLVTTFGIRTISMAPLRGTKAEEDYRWQFVINGKPMFIMGANWCWSDPMLKLDSQKYQHLLNLTKRAGIQMLRCWGGGIIETDEFYRTCDEMGILVYQEFSYCWGPPDFPITDSGVLDRQVARVVRDLRNHPALIMWGGGNENTTIPGCDEALTLVGRRCRQFDPSRPFHRTSPWGGSGHNWGVFHEGLPIDEGFQSRPACFYGEFGMPSMSNYHEALRYLPGTKLTNWPPDQNDGGLIGHMNQFSYGDMAKVMRYANYGPIKSWKDYIEYSQMVQGDEITYVSHLQRAGSYINKGGFWFYKMTDLFPGHAWAVVGFYGEPKLSYYRAKQMLKPQAGFADFMKYDWTANELFKASIHASNDTNGVLNNANVKAVIYGSDLKPLWSKQYAVPRLETSQHLLLDEISVNLDATKINPFLMAVSLYNEAGVQLSDQWYWFNFRSTNANTDAVEKIAAWGFPHEKAPEAFAAYASLTEAPLLNLPRTTVEASYQLQGSHGKLTVRNTGTLPAFNVIIDDFPYSYGSYLDDNSFCLYPKEEREIGFELGNTAVSTTLSVRAWNADVSQVDEKTSATMAWLRN
jgi:hypothetical protein